MSRARDTRPRTRQRTPESTLAERYRKLQERHREVLARLNDDARGRSSLLRLSWFALERSSSALALYRAGRVALANSRWHALASARAHGGGWIVGIGAERRTYPDVCTLAAAELTRLPAGPATLQCRRADGSELLRVRLERVLPPGQEPVGLVLADDVTDEAARQTEMVELRASGRKRDQLTAIGRVAAGAAHDLGNTLNALALRLYALARLSGGTARQELHGMQDAIEMMRQTLDRLDRFSGRRARPLSAVAIAPVVRAAVQVAGLPVSPARGAHAAKGRATVKLELPRRLPRVVADPAELTNVLMNLLINARDAMPRGGIITVRAAADKKSVTVRVVDEGPGFAPAHLERVFEPFFTTKGANGSGLGLSLAYGFMQAIGGNIAVGNRAEGGAEILLELPLASVARARRRGGLVDVRRRHKRLQ